MSGNNVIRGARIGSGPAGEMERGELAPRFRVSYWCEQGHETESVFAYRDDLEVPEQWTCVRCGEPAGLDQENPPPGLRTVPYKTHKAYVLERRTEAEGNALLDEALAALRARRRAPVAGVGKRSVP